MIASKMTSKRMMAILVLGIMLGNASLSDPISDAKPAATETNEMEAGVWRSLFERLDKSFSNQISSRIAAADQHFAPSDRPAVNAPASSMRIGLLLDVKEGAESKTGFAPNLDLDIKLPNIERSLRLFVESARENELPARESGELDDGQVSVGLRRWFKKLKMTTDAGVRTDIPPEGFVRATWDRIYTHGDWRLRPEQRFFIDSKQGYGSRTSLDLRSAIGKIERGQFRSASIAKWSSDDDNWSWEQSFKIGFVEVSDVHYSNIDGYSWGDSRRAQGIHVSVFGEDGLLTGYRSMLGFRGPLLAPWVFWEIDPGLEWLRENSFAPTYRLRAGIDIIFGGK